MELRREVGINDAEAAKTGWKSTLATKIKSNLQICLIFFGIFFGFVIAFPLRLAEIDLQGATYFWIKIWGDIFLRLLHLLMLPLIIFCIINGVSTLNPKSSGRLGLYTFIYIFGTNGLGAFIGLLSGSLLLLESEKTVSERNTSAITGFNVTNTTKTTTTTTTADDNGGESLNDIFANLLMNLFPKNIIQSCFSRYSGGIGPNVTVDGTNYLGLITFSLIVGVSLASMESNRKSSILKSFVEGVIDVCFNALNGVLWTAPIGVCSLIVAGIVSAENLGAILADLLWFNLTVIFGLVVYVGVCLPIILFVVAKKFPLEFAKTQISVAMTAFAMQSSALTLPAMFRACEIEARIPPRLTRFSLPLASMLNRDGSNVFMSVACIFVAKAVRHSIHFGDAAVIWLMISILSMCAAAVPSSSILVLLLVFSSTGIEPGHMIGLLYSVDWLLDRLRTSANCVSHCVCCFVLQYVMPEEEMEEEEEEEEREEYDSQTTRQNEEPEETARMMITDG